MMLYEWYEAQRALLSPFSEFASASSKLYNHPLSLFAHTPNAHRVSAGLELMHRLAKDYEKPQFDIRSIDVDGTPVAVHERVAIEKPFCRLLRFKRFTDDLPTLQRLKKHPTVLVIAPLSGHHSTLLRETVRELLKSHKVFLTDWTDARMVPGEQGPVPPRRLRRLRAGVHPLRRPRGQRDLGLPADRCRCWRRSR
jgi:poly(3-hydroxybutyrate) depolymerase